MGLGLVFAHFAFAQLEKDGGEFERLSNSSGLRLDAGSVDLFSCGDEVAVELGHLWCGTTYDLELSLLNSGSATIVIEKVTSSCGCFNGVSESNEIAPGGKTRQRVSMTTSEAAEFSQQLEMRSPNFVGVKKLKFLANCRPRATFEPAKLRPFDGKAQTVICVPTPNSGFVSGVSLDHKSPNFIEIQGNMRQTEGGAVSFDVVPVQSIIGSRIGFKQNFRVEFVENGKASSSIIPIESKGISTTRFAPSSLKFVQRDGEPLSVVLFVSRGEDVADKEWDEFATDVSKVTMVDTKGSSVDIEVVVKSRIKNSVVLRLFLRENAKSEKLIDCKVCLHVGEKLLFVPVSSFVSELES